MQRILQPGEIEALDHIDFPRVRLPQPVELFTERAARLRQRAQGHPIGDYLSLLALLVDGQARAAASVVTAPAEPSALERALTHGLPPLPAAEPPDPAWRPVLRALLAGLAGLAGSGDLPEAALATVQALQARDDPALEALARAVLDGEGAPAAEQPFVMAALQVTAADRASRLDARRLPAHAPATVCPVCGSPPVASVLRIGGQAGGHRYLHCGLCATEWHMVRVKCSHCESTRGVRYQAVEGGDAAMAAMAAVAAETCDACHSYRKLVNQERDPLAEPLADDLASLALDLLMAETAYGRASANPLLAFAP